MRPGTIPPAFWDSMSEAQREAIEQLDAYGLIMYPTGSRMICPELCSPGDDWDVFFLLPSGDDIIQWMIEHGWHTGRDLFVDDEAPNGMSMHLYRVHATCIYNNHIFSGWKLATDLCVELGRPTKREDRVAVFRRICNGL